MMVDDDEYLLKGIKVQLEETQKYEVLTLSDATDILAQLHGFKPDIILLDVLMPAMGGIDVCKLLNRDPIGRRTPIIILSALDEDSDKLKAYKVGVVDYLSKPFDKEDLIAKIEQALEFK